MRKLKFNVDNQIITRDPDCDFKNLIPGTTDYLRAEFTFTPDWNGWKKIANFYSVLGVKYASIELKDGKSCDIPAEALKKRIFKIEVIGQKGKSEMVTNKVEVVQRGGNK